MEIKNGATLLTNRLSKLTVSDSTVGPDFIVNGTWEYNSEYINSTNDYSLAFDVSTGTWQLGANGTVIKTNTGSSSILRSRYQQKRCRNLS